MPETSGEDTDLSLLPTPAAAAAAFGTASFDTGLARAVGRASTLDAAATGLEGRARPDRTGFDGAGAGFAVADATPLACTGAPVLLGTAGLLGASAFFPDGFDSLHFSRSSSSSLPLWYRSAGSFDSAFMMRSLKRGCTLAFTWMCWAGGLARLLCRNASASSRSKAFRSVTIS